MVDTIGNLKSDVIQTLSGTIDRLVTDPEDKVADGFVLKDATGQVAVDTNEALKLTIGDAVTVVGESEIDDDGTSQFEALKITKSDGTVILNPFGTAGAGPNDDILDGTNGRDDLDGGAGKDYLKGRGGKDRLTGGGGTDILVGGKGKDILTGGKGKDEFVYESLQDRGDRITDFSAKKDTIVLDGVFADDLFEDITSGSLDQFADYLKLSQVGANTVVRVDADGTAGANSFKTLTTLKGVDAADLTVRNFLFG